MHRTYACILLFFSFSIAKAQTRPTSSTITQLDEVRVIGYKSVNGIGHFMDSQQQILYAGKKTEVILTDSIDANKAINNTRQILGRIPGLNIVESETGGFVANGIGVRGLNPAQSLDMNVRQNGYTIAADVYGYNESYYLPPMEAVERIEVVRGGASLAFGSQFGGMINYVLKSGASHKRIELNTFQTGGSFGLLNSYNALGGTLGKVNYFGFLQYRTYQGWRPNSRQQQVSGFGKLTYQATPRLTVGLEYSLLQNRIKMPGGLTDAQAEADLRQSVRARNWLRSPWNILNASLTYTVSPNTTFSLQSTYLAGERSLVWFDENPDKLDLPDTRGIFANREIEREFVKSSSTEARFLTNYSVGSMQNTLTGGVRLAYSAFQRQEDATGTTGSDFDLSLTSPGYEIDINFTTLNVAPYLENTFRLTDRFSLTPGIRFEYLSSETEGEIEDESTGSDIEADYEKARFFPLAGLGLQFQTGPNGQLYGNFSQAYRPITYADLTPLAVSSRIAPNLRDARGYNLDLGYRTNWKNILNLDVSAFYLAYKNRLGLVAGQENGLPITTRTNVANSLHMGVESYLELNILKWLKPSSKTNLSLFNSLAYTNARYVMGSYKNNKVEYAPALINRIGLSIRKGKLMTTAQFSHQSEAFGDATNTRKSVDGIVGVIPAYSVADLSATYQTSRWKIKAGVNNLTNARYFTHRTDEYPGPGIIPSIGRNGYVGIGFTM